MPGGDRLKRFVAVLYALVLAYVPFACAQEPDHEIHEQLRTVLKEVTGAINAGQYDKMLPYLAENVEATSITQEVMNNRADVAKYFQEWFGPTGYMRKMTMTLDADKLTEFSPDKSWGLVRGKGARALRGEGRRRLRLRHEVDRRHGARRRQQVAAAGDPLRHQQSRQSRVDQGQEHADTRRRHCRGFVAGRRIGLGWFIGRRRTTRAAVNAATGSHLPLAWERKHASMNAIVCAPSSIRG
jgi:hypothetical protein